VQKYIVYFVDGEYIEVITSEVPRGGQWWEAQGVDDPKNKLLINPETVEFIEELE